MVIAYGTPIPEKSRIAASHGEGVRALGQGEARIKLCPIDRRDYPPIAPAHRQDQSWGMYKEPALEIEPDEKLRWLRRLDGTRRWQFLDDRRCCRCCGKSFAGRQIEIVGGTRPHGPLRLTCPTRNCSSAPADWLYLHETPTGLATIGTADTDRNAGGAYKTSGTEKWFAARWNAVPI